MAGGEGGRGGGCCALPCDSRGEGRQRSKIGCGAAETRRPRKPPVSDCTGELADDVSLALCRGTVTSRNTSCGRVCSRCRRVILGESVAPLLE